ncbi:dihydrofolate reductase family protein [Pengzhenrongella frigida]|uniref:Dihydrofolate reductase n=1 Tax=Pengzhenrongella frigida TaxID=1259133 RepID=A0A4Q5N4Z8_9MICO|nr:dihydrofolate reductase family protein [Cellulomonas sp. HLT2-17]RYV51111.1 dihydrofolate reductase [Cellulomonas sp. HLT2-17]
MRTVTAHLFHSVDGVVESPNLWQFDQFDDELGQAMGAAIAKVGTVLLGRVSYQEWASYWPNAADDDPFAAFINPVEKLVVSRTLTGDLEWQNARLLEGDLLTTIAAMRNDDGGDIAVNGSISVVRQLLFAGLLDALTLTTHPVVAGSGRRLFEPGDPQTRLTLLDSSTTSKGNTIAVYGPRR